MNTQVRFDKNLIDRYDTSGPRYTSYPTSVQFTATCNDTDYKDWVESSNNDPIPTPLSLYLHIPFCDTICYYCACSKIVTKDKSKASSYIEYLKKEIKLQGDLFGKDRPVVQIHWGGGTPTFLDNDMIADIVATIKENFNITEDNVGEFNIEVDPRTVDKIRVAELRKLGFNRISFGVQDFDPAVQKAVNRIHTTEEILSIIDAARESGFHSINIDLMYGLPKQSVASFEKTLDATIKASPDRIAIYNYAHMPDKFKPQRKIVDDELPSPDEKLEILHMTIQKLQAADYVYIGMDHFAKKTDSLVKAQQEGTLHRNFQGYSTYANCDIVAMGVTAISRIGDNYCQNVRTIDEYETSLNKNMIPVFRGFELEADDVLRREIINQLMCNFKLDIKRIETKWGISFNSFFASAMNNLHQMQTDGLLKIDNDFITVSDTGRLLVRSICMEFDRYLHTDNEQQRFSKII